MPTKQTKDIDFNKEYKGYIQLALEDYEVKSIKELNIYQKLSIIQCADLEVKKTGVNNFEGYGYKTFTDIKRALNPYLKPLHLTIISNIDEKTIKTGITNKGKSTIEYLKTWTIVNADNTQEKLDFLMPSYGLNGTQEKSFGTSITYSLKYFFNDVFLVPDESLDADALDNREPQGALVQPEPPKPKDFKDVFKEWVINEAKTNSKFKEKWLVYKKEHNITNLQDITDIQRMEIGNLSEKEMKND